MTSQYTAGFYRGVGGHKLVRGQGNNVEWNFGVLALGTGANAMPFADLAADLQDTWRGEAVLLYEAARAIFQRDLDPGPQKIGDCVSWGWSGSEDLALCVEASLGRADYSWAQRCATEARYALSRVEYGNLDGSYSDGSVGSWAQQSALRGGSLSRSKLGSYDPRRAKEWGARGLPDEMEPEAKTHVCAHAGLVTTFEQAADAIKNGYPVAVCSGVGFEGSRDSQGFIKARGSWAHCMKFVGVLGGDRPGLLCANSWGNDHAGEPKGSHDIPDNAWWVDKATVNRMLSEEDSFAPSGPKGYERRVLPWIF